MVGLGSQPKKPRAEDPRVERPMATVSLQLQNQPPGPDSDRLGHFLCPLNVAVWFLQRYPVKERGAELISIGEP